MSDRRNPEKHSSRGTVLTATGTTDLAKKTVHDSLPRIKTNPLTTEKVRSSDDIDVAST